MEVACARSVDSIPYDNQMKYTIDSSDVGTLLRAIQDDMTRHNVFKILVKTMKIDMQRISSVVLFTQSVTISVSNFKMVCKTISDVNAFITQHYNQLFFFLWFVLFEKHNTRKKKNDVSRFFQSVSSCNLLLFVETHLLVVQIGHSSDSIDYILDFANSRCFDVDTEEVIVYEHESYQKTLKKLIDLDFEYQNIQMKKIDRYSKIACSMLMKKNLETCETVVPVLDEIDITIERNTIKLKQVEVKIKRLNDVMEQYGKQFDEWCKICSLTNCKGPECNICNWRKLTANSTNNMVSAIDSIDNGHKMEGSVEQRSTKPVECCKYDHYEMRNVSSDDLANKDYALTRVFKHLKDKVFGKRNQEE